MLSYLCHLSYFTQDSDSQVRRRPNWPRHDTELLIKSCSKFNPRLANISKTRATLIQRQWTLFQTHYYKMHVKSTTSISVLSMEWTLIHIRHRYFKRSDTNYFSYRLQKCRCLRIIFILASINKYPIQLQDSVPLMHKTRLGWKVRIRIKA